MLPTKRVFGRSWQAIYAAARAIRASCAPFNACCANAPEPRMQLEQSFALPFALTAAWSAFADVPMLVSCMPGAALQGEPRGVENGADIDLIFTVKLGPITGAFQGQGEVRRDADAHSGTFSGAGADRKSGSRVKGEAKFALIATSESETRVDINVNYSLTGALAQFSRGAIVQELAAALTRDFAANL